MDYSSPAISLLIVLYGVHEYRRRENAHSAAMEHLRRGEVPEAAGSQPRSWGPLLTCAMCALLAGFAGILFYSGGHSRSSSAVPLEIMGGMITVPLLILVLIIVRDRRRYASPFDKGSER